MNCEFPVETRGGGWGEGSPSYDSQLRGRGRSQREQVKSGLAELEAKGTDRSSSCETTEASNTFSTAVVPCTPVNTL